MSVHWDEAKTTASACCADGEISSLTKCSAGRCTATNCNCNYRRRFFCVFLNIFRDIFQQPNFRNLLFSIWTIVRNGRPKFLYAEIFLVLVMTVKGCAIKTYLKVYKSYHLNWCEGSDENSNIRKKTVPLKDVEFCWKVLKSSSTLQIVKTWHVCIRKRNKETLANNAHYTKVSRVPDNFLTPSTYVNLITM